MSWGEATIYVDGYGMNAEQCDGWAIEFRDWLMLESYFCAEWAEGDKDLRIRILHRRHCNALSIAHAN